MTTQQYYMNQTVDDGTLLKWQRANTNFRGFFDAVQNYISEEIRLNEFGNKVPAIATIKRAIYWGYCPNPALEWAINEYLKSIKFK